jgi:hypothetical protein
MQKLYNFKLLILQVNYLYYNSEFFKNINTITKKS